MITVTGKIENASGAALHATIDFVSKSTPLVSAGVITTNTDKTIRSNPTDGTFSVQLAAGNYAVTVSAESQTTNFNIVVPPGSGTVSIDSIVSSPLAFTFTPPNQVFNGLLNGALTFNPSAPPPAPTWSLVPYAGGNVANVGTEHYAYWLSYVTQTGETVLGPALNISETGAAADSANRIFFPANPPGVISVNIWRGLNDPAHVYSGTPPYEIALLASVSPQAAYYDDWESAAQFYARADLTITPPLQNTTAGNIVTSPGGPTAFQFTDQGVTAHLPLSAPAQPLGSPAGVITKSLLDQVFGGGMSTSDVLFQFSAGQLQMWDVAAAIGSGGAMPWRALGVNNGQTVWSAPIAIGGALDDPFAIPAGANYRFANGQIQFWDAAQAATTPLTPWRALGISNGALYWSAPIAASGATLDVLPNPPGANWRVKNGQLQIWDQTQAVNDLSRPWRAIGVFNGATIISNPISN